MNPSATLHVHQQDGSLKPLSLTREALLAPTECTDGYAPASSVRQSQYSDECVNSFLCWLSLSLLWALAGRNADECADRLPAVAAAV